MTRVALAALVSAGNVSIVIVGRESGDVGESLIDDATSHLLLTATTRMKHLPMPGSFRLIWAPGLFSRERDLS